MRTKILTLTFILFTGLLFGQNENPYSQFGYEAPVMPEEERPLLQNRMDRLYLVNSDTASSIHMLAIDPAKRNITVFDSEGLVLQVDTLNYYTMARWLSADPYGQFSSPYIGMGNNPVVQIDADGGWSWVGSAIGTLAGVGVSFATGDQDNWYKYAIGGFIAGGIVGELAHSSHDLTSHASNGWDRFTARFGEGKTWGANGSIFNRYTPNPKWVDVGHSFIGEASQGVKKEWCVYACSEVIEKAFGGKRKMKDFAMGWNGGKDVDKGVNSNETGKYYVQNFPKKFKGQGFSSNNAAPSPSDIASEMKKGRIVSTVIDEGVMQGYNHNVVMKMVQRNIKNPAKYRYIIMDPAKGVRPISASQYNSWYRVHFYLGR
jgi:hypothetical protein